MIMIIHIALHKLMSFIMVFRYAISFAHRAIFMLFFLYNIFHVQTRVACRHVDVLDHVLLEVLSQTVFLKSCPLSSRSRNFLIAYQTHSSLVLSLCDIPVVEHKHTICALCFLRNSLRHFCLTA